MRTIDATVWTGAVLAALAFGNIAGAAGSTAVSHTATAAQSLYEIHCASCHGLQGDGEGPAAYLVYPKPRSFKTGLFRFRSTPSGSLPTDADLARTIRLGVPGTAMPSFDGLLAAPQIAELLGVVKGFSELFKTATAAKPVVIPPRPPRTETMVAQGRKVYETMGCAACHGPQGHGDGPASANLKDDRGFAIAPKDFTAGPFKSGSRPEDIYRTFVTGLDGTPMPSFSQLFEPGSKTFPFANAGWSLVYYIQSLQPLRVVRGIGSGALIPVEARADLAPLEDPESQAWQSVPAADVTLRPLFTRNDYAQTLSVRAARSDSRLALRLEWEDTVANTGAVGQTDFPDKAAVSFPLSSELPFIGMGSAAPIKDGKPGLVNIWCWRADSNEQARTGHFADIQDKHPLTEVDMYSFKQGWQAGEREDPAGDDVRQFTPTFLTGWGAGNLVSDPTLPRGQISEFNAVGFGTLTPQPARDQNVTGAGRWALGRWSLVFLRDLYTGGDGDVVMAHRDRIPLAFAVWDGKFNDRGGEKSVSNWHWLVFESKEAGK